jgi:hypothetical protein
MSDIRARGFTTKAEFEGEIAEFEDDIELGETKQVPSDAMDIEAARREIAWLRKEVYDLGERLSTMQGETSLKRPRREDRQPLLRIMSAVVMAFAVGRIVWRLR